MSDNHEREFQVTVSQTLSKDVSVFTDNYRVEPDEDGLHSYVMEDVNLKDLYKEQHYAIPELLKILRKDYEYRARNTANPKKAAYFKTIADECKNWVVDDFEVVE